MALSTYERLKQFPHVPLGDWPTPIEEEPLPGGGVLLVKRDDLSGHGRGGAKARKITHLLGYMLEAGYNDLVTVAGNVTNVIYDILPALAKYDLRHRLFIIDDPPALPEDRKELFADVADQLTLIGRSKLVAAWHLLRARRRSRKEGFRPLLVMPGVSHPSSIIGNACGFLEMVEQRQKAGLPLPRKVYITVATGSTIAGFLLAEQALREQGVPPIEIEGVQIYTGAAKWWTWALLRWTERFLKATHKVPFSRIRVSKAQLHGGFAHFSKEQSELCHEIDQRGTFRVDPIFGGKTWAHMMAEEAASDDERPILFWHCGYTPEWEMLGQVVERAVPVES